MKALLVKPNCVPEIIDLKNTLEDWYKYVGRPVEFVYPFKDRVAIICNEEGKLRQMAYNRPLVDDKGQVYDIITGNFLIVGLPPIEQDDGNICSLSNYQLQKFFMKFKTPYEFYLINNVLHICPMFSK